MPEALGIRADLNATTTYIKSLDKRAGAAFKRRVREALTESGSALVGDMRRRAGWSQRIQGAIVVKATFSEKKSGVRITVNHNEAPHARPYELGNKTVFDEHFVNANGGRHLVKSKAYPNGRLVVTDRKVYKAMKSLRMTSTVLRHPVFHAVGAPGGWAAVPLRPFFFAATAAGAPAVQKRMESALDAIANDLEFRGV